MAPAARPEKLPPAHVGPSDHHGPEDSRGDRAAFARRTNIVLTRQVDLLTQNCLIAGDRTEAVALAQATGSRVAFIIGGSQVYEAFLPLGPTIHVTLVEGSFPGDTFFPAAVLDSPAWEVVHQERWPADAENPHDASYLILHPRG